MRGFPLIIDGNSLVKRCIMATALDDLKAGEIWTGGVYGTLSMLSSYLSPIDGQAGPIIAFFDSGKSVKKLELLPTYKAARAEKKKLLTEDQHASAMHQMDLAREMLKMLGVVVLAYKDREADDGVAAAVSCLADYQPVVMTGDRDLWQCVRLARIWDLNKKRYITQDNFEEIVGVPHKVYTLYKALIGDSSDSIAGVPGCGPKRAQALVMDALQSVEAFDAYPPDVQLSFLLTHVGDKKKHRKFEESLLESEEHLRTVLKVINVWTQFGSKKGLAKKFEGMLQGGWPKVQKLPFLRFCKKLEFGSVLGNPDRFLRPFIMAQSRRK